MGRLDSTFKIWNSKDMGEKGFAPILLILIIIIICGGIFGGSIYIKNNYPKLIGNTNLAFTKNNTNITPSPTNIATNYQTSISPTSLPTLTISPSVSAKPHYFLLRGSSMTPNYLDKQIWVYQTYTAEQPKRFDVVIFDNPVAAGNIIDKRIIGLPNEKVKIMNGHVYINDQQLQESYTSTLTSVVNSETSPQFITEGQEKGIPANMYFVLGDNRPVSNDSRSWGLLSQEKIIGKLSQQVQPISMPTPPSQCPCLDSTNNLCLPQIACQ